MNKLISVILVGALCSGCATNTVTVREYHGELTLNNVRVIPDVVYGHKMGMALTYDVFRPLDSANGAAMLLMVSGGWVSQWSLPHIPAGRHFRPLLENGYTVITVRHGSSPKFTVPEALGDVRRAVRHVRMNAKRFEVDPNRLGVFGFSAGGHLSLMLGTTGDDGLPTHKDPLMRVSNRVQAVIAFFGPTELEPWTHPESPYYTHFPALQFDSRLAHAVSPIHHVTEDDAPILLVHGDKDQVVPIRHSYEIEKKFKEMGGTYDFIVMEGVRHSEPPRDKPEMRKHVNDSFIEWCNTHLLQ